MLTPICITPFSKEEKHALYCNMSNSHEKSRLFLAPKREVFPAY